MNTRERIQKLAARLDERLMQFVDLGKEDTDYCGGLSKSVRYPTLYIYGRDNPEIFNLPSTGKATIRYRVRSKTESTESDGKTRYSSDIEIQSIDPEKPEKASKGTKLEAMVGKYLKSFDSRARTAGGQYAPGDQPPGPQDIADAYGRKKKRAALVIGGATVAAGAAGALPVTRQGLGRMGAGLLRAAAR